MNPVKPWLIKVLNGPNAGAQLLVSKEITVGTSEECDLVLHDPHICALHCQIGRGEEEALTIIPKEGLLFINGHPVSGEKTKLQLGEVLTLGSTHLTAGPSQQLWPAVVIPQIQEVGGVPKPIESALPPASSVSKISGTEEKKETTGRRSKLSLFLLILIGFLILVGAVLFRVVAHKSSIVSQLSFQPSSFDTKEHEMEEKQEAVAETAAELLRKKFPKNTIKVIHNKEDIRLFIYVRNQVQYDDVRKFMNENLMPIPSNIINIDDIDDSALAMMTSMNLAVSVVVDPETGSVIWNGYLPDQALLDSVKEQIARDLPAITQEEFHIILGTDATKTIHAILQKKQLTAVNVTPERKDIALTGAINGAGKEALQESLQEMETAFNGQVKIVNMVTFNNQAIRSGIFDAPVVSVSISTNPYLVLQNGDRIFLGAKLQDGYIVNAITTGGIELINGASKKIIPVSGSEQSLF